MLNEADPIWGAMPTVIKPWEDGGRDVTCPRSGGRYRVTGSALHRLSGLPIDAKARLTTWIVDGNRRTGGEPPVIDSDMLEKRLAILPELSTGQKIDRFLLFLSDQKLRMGVKIDWIGPHTQTPHTIATRHAALAWIEAHTEEELNGMRGLLQDRGYLRNDATRFYLSAAGFARIEEMRRGVVVSDQVFVAMWFNPGTNAAYEAAIEPAIRLTGFRAVRIDRKEHNNKIDDEIIAEIRRSRFVVADFTCGRIEADGNQYCIPRGGVYYEAGFAQGLGIPVIWTVRADQINDVHFDTRQFNHIAWTDEADLKTRLFNRIRATFPDAV